MRSYSELLSNDPARMIRLPRERAAALTGDKARARQAYQDFFVLWKDADPDVPILQEARQEYEKLK